MKNSKIAVSLMGFALLFMASCKKDKAEDYYLGKWSVRESQYTSPDTSYISQIDANINVYDFKSGNTVEITSLGTDIVMDSWLLKGNHDSLLFGNNTDWKIVEKNANRFRVKYYANSNVLMTLTLER